MLLDSAHRKPSGASGLLAPLGADAAVGTASSPTSKRKSSVRASRSMARTVHRSYSPLPCCRSAATTAPTWRASKAERRCASCSKNWDGFGYCEHANL